MGLPEGECGDPQLSEARHDTRQGQWHPPPRPLRLPYCPPRALGNRFIANPCGRLEGEAAPAPIAVSRGCCGVRGGGGGDCAPDHLFKLVQKEKVLTGALSRGRKKSNC